MYSEFLDKPSRACDFSYFNFKTRLLQIKNLLTLKHLSETRYVVRAPLGGLKFSLNVWINFHEPVTFII